MNVISHKRIVIDFDVWEPFKKASEQDLDDLVLKIKAKELLKHCGNIHLNFQDDSEIKGDK